MLVGLTIFLLLDMVQNTNGRQLNLSGTHTQQALLLGTAQPGTTLCNTARLEECRCVAMTLTARTVLILHRSRLDLPHYGHPIVVMVATDGFTSPMKHMHDASLIK